MPVRDDLGTRMKSYYEEVPKFRLYRRTPVAIRIDGKAFHTFTRGFKKPFDEILIKTMQQTMKYLCENIQGCVLGYTQSDEITLILQDYKTLITSAWFDYEIQKICSISAKITGEYPVFLLDDVLSELDDKRKRFVLSGLEGRQVIITCCDEKDAERIAGGRVISLTIC